MDAAPPATRRIQLTLGRPALTLWAGIRPTLVIGGRGQPVQWGAGTWQVAADEPVELGVYLFARGWRFGDAGVVLHPTDPPTLHYRAPILPFGRGRFISL
ncbi:hypothetical protein FBY40_3311 [Microbacterium sp. SLBN-154]|uniref:hypothetical protein n=1 Tax=Microbacterium sp. SLBN-154 TaxID=2768458 RepID=UPI0011508178|nr:hypothetical protein [Microbacterium sp. SLBN-154]TQK20767.1 hypothetical protein FBY40_3311 [Microbacterium sp. SLBN-154]